MSLLPKRIAHWTPTYVADRLRVWQWQRRHPEAPWLTPEAIDILAANLRPSDRGLEWGSGRSTLWLAQRLERLCSVEHNSTWFARVSQQLSEKGVGNVDYVYRPVSDERDAAQCDPYAGVAHEFADQSLDFVLVDGVCRSACMLAVLPKLRPGGMLVLDNSQRYLPSASRAPGARSPSAGPQDDEWGRVSETLSRWRYVWTDTGLESTTIWFVV